MAPQIMLSGHLTMKTIQPSKICSHYVYLRCRLYYLGACQLPRGSFSLNNLLRLNFEF